MTIEPTDRRRVRITLDEEDMRFLGVTYAELMTGGPSLAPVLRKLLAAAREQAGFETRDKKLLIELYPAQDGGCVLCFTGIDAAAGRYRIKGERLAPCLFRFEDADALVAGCRAVYRQMSHRVLCSSLYYLRGFILCVRPLDTPPSQVFSLLGEYARCIGKGRLLEAVVGEHAKTLREGDAIDALAAP